MSEGKSIDMRDLSATRHDSAEAREQAEAARSAKVNGHKRRSLNRSESYLLRMSPEQRVVLQHVADALGCSFNDALLRSLEEMHKGLQGRRSS